MISNIPPFISLSSSLFIPFLFLITILFKLPSVKSFPTDPPKNIHFGALRPSSRHSELGRSCGWTEFNSINAFDDSDGISHGWVALSYLYPDMCNRTIIVHGSGSYNHNDKTESAISGDGVEQKREARLTVIDVDVCATPQEREDVGPNGWMCSGEDIVVEDLYFDFLFPEEVLSEVRKSKGKNGETVSRVMFPRWEIAE